MRFLVFILFVLTAGAAFADEKVDNKTTLFAAADISSSTKELVKRWYLIGVDAWGSHGPTEIYVVGSSFDAAKELEDAFCERRKKLNRNWDVRHDCANKHHKIFRHMPEEGGAYVSSYIRPNLTYDFYTLTMGSSRPYPDEEDYKQTILHEYWHIYQHSKISDECTTDRRDKCERDKKLTGNYEKTPWVHEGSANYMGLLEYSRHVGSLRDMRRQMFRYKDRSFNNYFSSSQKLNEFTYDYERRLAYDIGTWFVAYLVYREGETALKDAFYGDLDKYGFERSFERNFGKSTEDYISEFTAFIAKNRNNKKELNKLFHRSLMDRDHRVNLETKKAFASLSLCQRKALQSHFAKEGFYKSSIDGLWGKNTKAAFDKSLSSNKLDQIDEGNLAIAYGLEDKCD
ncbi:hypothetical protein ACMAZE_15290 [Pseudopelagicola sp. nBUS_20]|uniref:hypothetical protein n=1 Tax=Pseudopelagicola sp. nBUS_20 TaxID=3395317 RepID=UPI003EBDC499